jgi:NADPH:quinone reductase-like Zn-dependent oxidoreductase
MASQPVNVAAVLPSAASALVLEERAIPTPGPDEILIRNHDIALNPVDWKRQAFGFAVPSYPTILGADVAGVVVAVGSAVTSFQRGDRVLGIGHSMASGNMDNAAFQTYTVVWAGAATKVPDSVTLAQAATLPSSLATAAITLFDVLGFPQPQSAASNPARNEGILIWGGASASGASTIQLARLLGLTVFATASPRHHARVRELGAADVVDYRSPSAVDDILAAARRTGVDIIYAVDTVSSAETLTAGVQVLTGSGAAHGKKLAHLGVWPEQVVKPEGPEISLVLATAIWDRRRDLSAWLFNERLGNWLKGGEVVPLPVKIVDGGLGGLQKGLDELKKGVSGEKLVVEL